MDATAIRRELASATSEDELERIYRYLCKQTHPDTAGGDGYAFVVLQDEYDLALKRLSPDERTDPAKPVTEQNPPGSPPNTAAHDAPFDPWAVIGEIGGNKGMEPRAALYLALYRYQSANLGSPKIRLNPGLRKRNGLIIRTVLYWAAIYDPDFSRTFLRWDRVQVERFMPTAYLKAASNARRNINEGFDRFIRFQEDGRTGQRVMAKHSLETAIDTAQVYHVSGDGLIELATWLLHELDFPPALQA